MSVYLNICCVFRASSSSHHRRRLSVRVQSSSDRPLFPSSRRFSHTFGYAFLCVFCGLCVFFWRIRCRMYVCRSPSGPLCRCCGLRNSVPPSVRPFVIPATRRVSSAALICGSVKLTANNNYYFVADGNRVANTVVFEGEEE